MERYRGNWQKKRHARLMAARAERAATGVGLDPTIERINTLARVAQRSWFALLSYMAYVGITLMGVKDEDFFLIEKQTDLPLIGVTIPTFLFFAIAPPLGAALFMNLHLYLQKLWEALGDAPATWRNRPLSDLVSPWLVIDFALTRKARALRPRPMRWLVHLLGYMLVYIGAPFVLSFFWWRSMPAHNPLLTLLICSVALAMSLYIALVSLQQLNRQVGERQGLRTSGVWALSITTLAIFAVGWFRSVEPAGTYLDSLALRYLEWRDAERLKAADTAGKQDILDGHKESVAAWFWNKPPFSMAAADLRNANFAYLPENWRNYDEERAASRAAFCDEREIPKLVCEAFDRGDLPDPDIVRPMRLTYCKNRFGAEHADLPIDCERLFKRFSEELERYQDARWNAALASFPSRDLSGEDFRFAYLRGAKLQKANLSRAKMQSAFLFLAKMQGADLSEAEMQGALLAGAEMQGADLCGAKMQGAFLDQAEIQGADLYNARMQYALLRAVEMQGAILVGAEMQGADLRSAKMQGADLSGAKMQGAILVGAEMDDTTNLGGTLLRGAAVSEVDLSEVTMQQAQLESMLGNQTVKIPHGLTRPKHWLVIEDEDPFGIIFLRKWKAWQRKLGFDLNAEMSGSEDNDGRTCIVKIVD